MFPMPLSQQKGKGVTEPGMESKWPTLPPVPAKHRAKELQAPHLEELAQAAAGPCPVPPQQPYKECPGGG